MLGDLTEKIQSSQSRLEELMDKIPGIGGYRRKEQRREADKLLRMHIARELEGYLKRLGEVQYTLATQGRLDVNLALERATTKLQLLIDRLKTASYGYAGLFDAVKVDEEVLDRLYDFDERMLDAAAELEASIAQLEQTAEGEDLMTQANGLIRHLEALNSTFSQRQDVIIE